MNFAMSYYRLLWLCAAKLGLTSILLTGHAAEIPAVKHWPQWRGPLANGVAPLGDPPLRWSEINNIKWKVKIPGFGTSTPIIWDTRVFILTAIPAGQRDQPKKVEPIEGAADGPAAQDGPPPNRRGPRGPSRSEAPVEAYQFAILCLDRATGKTLWQKIAREQVPHEGHHRDHGFASASPITDGRHLFAFFGSRGLYCYDLDGNQKWEKDFGDMQTKNSFGEGSSPALHGNTIVILWDHEGEDFIVALDTNTGKELWRQKRDESTTWSTPLIVEQGGKTQVVVNATSKVRSYDLASGKQLWEGPGLTANAIPSPVYSDGVVYTMSGFRGAALYAIKLDRTGDVTGTDAILWSYTKSTPYVPSPLLTESLLYFVSGNNGILSCFDAKSGKPHYESERLEGIRGIYASPVAAQDRVYVLGREGTALVLKKSPKLEVLATNTLDDHTDASIAIVDRELFIRGHQYLYCIAEK